MGAEGAGRSASVAVQQTIAASALAGERVVSIARLLFCLAAGGRSTYYWLSTDADHRLERAWLTYPALGAAILFSAAVLLGAGRRRGPGLVLHLSVTMDALVAFVVLLPNSIWPGPGYQGAPFLIDTAAILVMTMAAGLRHSPSAAALGGLLNGASLAGLAVTDALLAGVSAVDLSRGYTMYGCLLAGVSALSLLIAVSNRRLVERAARAAVAAEQAGHGLRSLLRDHHDLRTVVTSAQVNADLLARGLAGGAAETIAHLREDLVEIRGQLEQVKGRALEELADLEERLPAAVDQVVADVVSALTPRFPAVTIHAAAAGVGPALVAGGPPTLRRILTNLVVNACEGDGRRTARRVDLRARALAAGRIAIEVADDGPGLPAHVLAAPAEATSTKPAGTGFGIGIVDGLVRASGGSVSWRNHDDGGALIVVELSAAGGEPPG